MPENVFKLVYPVYFFHVTLSEKVSKVMRVYLITVYAGIPRYFFEPAAYLWIADRRAVPCAEDVPLCYALGFAILFEKLLQVFVYG